MHVFLLSRLFAIALVGALAWLSRGDFMSVAPRRKPFSPAAKPFRRAPGAHDVSACAIRCHNSFLRLGHEISPKSQ